MTEVDIAQSPAGAAIEYDVKIVDGDFVAHASAAQAGGAVSEDVTTKISGAKVRDALIAESNAKLGAFAAVANGIIMALFAALGVK